MDIQNIGKVRSNFVLVNNYNVANLELNSIYKEKWCPLYRIRISLLAYFSSNKLLIVNIILEIYLLFPLPPFLRVPILGGQKNLI